MQTTTNGYDIDGIVISGSSAVDEALITGESLPVDKSTDDTVVGGAINGNGTLLIRVTAVGTESFLHQVISSVEKALEVGVNFPDVEDFQAESGRGVKAQVDGETVWVGSPAFLESQGIDLSALTKSVETAQQGHTVIVVARDNRLLGAIALGDALRVDTIETISQLHELGIRTAMLTGDNERTARHIAERAGIDEVYAGVLPADKAEVLRDMQRQSRVAMVGDGINDAPALMQADVGIAMGSGTDIAIDSADIIILNGRVGTVITAWEISRWGYRKILQNVSLAFLFNGIGIPLATTGLIYPVWAMVAMATSVTAIFINSLWQRPDMFFDAVASVGDRA